MPQVRDVIRVVITVKRDGLLRPIEERRDVGLRRLDLSAFVLSLAHCELREGYISETILHPAKGMPQIRRVIDEQVHTITQISVE
jgi:hypothetical protein